MISLNTRGLQNVQKRLSVFRYLKQNKCDIAFLQETYSKAEDEQRWLQQWEGQGYFVHGTNHSKGVAILFRKNLNVTIEDKKLDSKGRFILLKTIVDDYNINLLNVYAPNREKEQVQFFEEMMRILVQQNVFNTDNNIFAGDWNVVLNDAMDKWGGICNIKEKSIRMMDEIKEYFDLEDIWRVRNGNTKRYTWRQKSPRIHCRLDYFLTSANLSNYIVESKILPSFLSDHSPVTLSLRFFEEPQNGPGHWKLNLSLLSDECYVKHMKENLDKWIDMYQDIQDKNLKWDLIKYEIRAFSIKYSKDKAKQKRDDKRKLEAELSQLETKEAELDRNEELVIENLRSELKKMYHEETQGLIIRSRAKWSEEGEKNTSYFFNLEKYNKTCKNIKKIIHNDKEVTNQAEILNAIAEYYRDMYKQDNCNVEETDIFEHPNIKKLNEQDQEKVQGEITLEECSKIINLFAKNKTPGNDGLQIEFYIKFWDYIGPLLVECFNFSFRSGVLSNSQRQAVISLLAKKDKDRLYVENWRPISLLNIDYKVLSKCLSERVKKVIEKLIDNSQSGFIKDRNTSDCIRTILDIIDTTEKEESPGLLITVDFQKAFDSLSWDFLFKALNTFNFGDNYIAWVRLCYTNISSCIINYKTTSQYFPIEKGVRQGDPLSPYLFILAVELMSIQIRSDTNIKGIVCNGKEIKIVSYADDTTAFLRDENDAAYLFNRLKEFEKCSGLKVNKSKTEGFWLGSNRFSNFKPLGIKWSSVIKILGISISYDKEQMIKMNYENRILKIKKILSMWKQRDLTIYGKILILKTFALSQLLYASLVLPMPKKILNEAQAIMYNYLWNGPTYKVKKDVVTQGFEKGGCKMIDLQEMIDVQKLKWIKKILNDKEYTWKYTAADILGIKHLDIYIRSNPEPPKNTSQFYADILAIWRKIRDNKLENKAEVIDQMIWYNKYLKIDNKILICNSFIKKGITKIGDLLNDNDRFKSFQEVVDQYGIEEKYFLYYSGLIKSIPQSWKDTINRVESLDNHEKLYINIDNQRYDFLSIDIKRIYECLVNQKSSVSAAVMKYSNQFDIDSDKWKEIYTLPHNINISNKAKELQYKIIHGYIATNKKLFQMKLISSPRCNFCNLYTQDCQHLFFECLETKNMWLNIQRWLKEDYNVEYDFTLYSVLFGVYNNCSREHVIINQMIMYCKLYIYKCKYKDISLNMTMFKNYFLRYAT